MLKIPLWILILISRKIKKNKTPTAAKKIKNKIKELTNLKQEDQ